MARLVCTKCRAAYFRHQQLELAPPDFGDSIEELLHGEMCFPSACFYAGGAFDSTRVRANARTRYQYMGLLASQRNAEESKYLIRNGSHVDYKQRFTFGYELETLLKEASEIFFAESGRRPLGLNPERFVVECFKCQKRMLGKEYGTITCEDCESRTLTTKGDTNPSEWVGSKRQKRSS